MIDDETNAQIRAAFTPLKPGERLHTMTEKQIAQMRLSDFLKGVADRVTFLENLELNLLFCPHLKFEGLAEFRLGTQFELMIAERLTS